MEGTPEAAGAATTAQLQIKDVNESHEPGFLIARVLVKDLKEGSIFRTLFNKVTQEKSPQPANATIEPVFHPSKPRSFHLRVVCTKGEWKGKSFELNVNRTKYDFDPAQSYYKIKDDYEGRILLYLKKLGDTWWYPENEPYPGTLETNPDPQS